MAIIENLYPPIVMDTIPAFIRTGTCKIYFSLSIYTSKADIKNVQVSVVNQRTNISALRRDLFPSEIKLAHLQQDETKKDNYNYYIQISPEEDLEAGTFEINQFYKVQLRFTSELASDPPVNGKIATWLEENINHFSEWSKVCLIKGIAQPLIETNFDNKTEFDIAPTQFIGRLYYEQAQETEHLDNYTIKIYKSLESNKILYNSGIIYTDSFNPNEINYQILFDFQKQTTYVLELSFETNNSYSGIKTYSFLINSTEVPEIPISITATPQEDYGWIDIALEPRENESFRGTLVVKRASSKTNFIIWDIIKTIEHENEQNIPIHFQDVSIESGIWYLYRIQGKLLSGEEKAPVQIPTPIMCVFDDIYIMGDGIQLKIQFNPTVGDFKYNILESQQITLGSQYPYIRINGKSKYRSFSLGGLISSLSDRNDWYKNNLNDNEGTEAIQLPSFMNKRQAYGAAAPLYKQYNIDNNVSDYLDILYERAFREKVYDFLYGNNVKLFKSTTEGNILVRLSNISFQPQEVLGRKLYAFTATATEVDAATTENYFKYNIINNKINDVKAIMTLSPSLGLNPQGILTLEAYGIEPNSLTLQNFNLLLEENLFKGGSLE